MLIKQRDLKQWECTLSESSKITFRIIPHSSLCVLNKHRKRYVDNKNNIHYFKRYGEVNAKDDEGNAIHKNNH